jgi:hypothetical protein
VYAAKVMFNLKKCSMKKILFLIVALISLISGNIYAQEVVTEPSTSFVIDLGTFTGIVAVVSTLVTQITKVVPAISDSKLIKILISVVTGIAVCMACWLLKATPLLNDLVWWQSLLYGLAVGLSGCGFYDIVKAIGGLFGKQDEVIHYNK